MESKKNKEKKERRRGFTLEFKAEAVRLLAERPAGVSVAQLARELDVRPEQLRAWARQRREDASPSSSASSAGTRPGETLEQENRRLRRELAVAREEQAFAKKVAAYFAKESR
jgi:transposase